MYISGGRVGVGVAVGVRVAVGVEGVLVRVGVTVGVGEPPHPGNLNEPMRVFQGAVPVLGIYSVVNQKVQSSTGSTEIAA